MNSFHARTAKPKPAMAKAAVRPVTHASGLRVDALLVQRGLAASRTLAQRLIEAGRVFAKLGAGDTAVLKPSLILPPDVVLRVAPSDEAEYVSRGGFKLAGALTRTGILPRDKLCLDIGQSTGGFTDCLLQRGAAHVVGVDVGHDQLAAVLRNDPRVECFEGINARDLQNSALVARQDGRKFALIVADVSFISLTLVLPQLPALLASDGDLLLLVKPQFEVGQGKVGKGGIVRDTTLYREVEAKLRACCADHHLHVVDWFDSPITGTDGNHEFFLHLRHEH